MLYGWARLFVYGGALALAGCGNAETGDEVDAPQQSADRELPDTSNGSPEFLVMTFGDSLYAGYGVQQSESFAAVLERQLQVSGVDVRVLNASVSGDTSAAGRQRLDFALSNLRRKPDLLLLGLGGNDMLRGVAPTETRANLEAMLIELDRRDIDVMLTGMLAAPNLGDEFGNAFNVIYPELAQTYDAQLYPFFLAGVVGDSDLMLPDGVHPNAQGINAIVDKIAPQVEVELTD